MVEISSSGAPEADGSVPDGDASAGTPTARRALPRAARLSRLAQATPPAPVPDQLVAESPTLPVDTTADALAAAVLAPPATLSPAPAPPPPILDDAVVAAAAPTSPPAPTPIVAPAPIVAAAPTVGLAEVAQPSGSRPMVQMMQLMPNANPTPSPAVLAAQEAAALAASDAMSGPVVFKPLNDSMAARSVILSAIGLLLCFFPVFSLAGLVMGVLAQRRIRRSNGQLIGLGSAKFGILLGAIGVVVGATVDMVFLVGR